MAWPGIEPMRGSMTVLHNNLQGWSKCATRGGKGGNGGVGKVRGGDGGNGQALCMRTLDILFVANLVATIEGGDAGSMLQTALCRSLNGLKVLGGGYGRRDGATDQEGTDEGPRLATPKCIQDWVGNVVGGFGGAGGRGKSMGNIGGVALVCRDLLARLEKEGLPPVLFNLTSARFPMVQTVVVHLRADGHISAPGLEPSL
ncbi:hypothetical protein B0H16DRAFT_1473935 [Mycena metata]|uniref:Uncharacterized protein n=1 Tax=Mycena metata TaxID=1033252 RepID=A0AAD7MKR7_9AGAR|nr:hypothetical protein B0H16DRAFT_1473935 [Mycena metata]